MGRDVGKRPTAVGHAPWRRPRYRRRRMLKQAMAHDLARCAAVYKSGRPWRHAITWTLGLLRGEARAA